MLVKMVGAVVIRLRGTLLILLIVRVSAKELTSLILDEDRLRTERADRKNWKSRVTGLDDFAEPSHAEPPRRQRPQRADEEDAEYRLAIEASKFQEEEDRKKRESRHGEPDDDDLAKAIKLSQEEEELRRRELEEQNAHSLFDDDPIQVAQPTGFNQGYQQQGAVDWSGNPIDPSLQTQPTGYLNPYTTFQTQPTGFQNGYQNSFSQQPTGFDQFGTQPQQQQQQQSFMQQPTGFNPYNQFQQQPQQQQQQQFQAPQQQQSLEPIIPAGTNNPWATNNQSQSLQSLQPMPTGSNNPFASTFNRPQTSHASSKPTLSTLQEQKTLSQFNNPSFNPPTTFTPPAPQKELSEHEARLNALLASGDGMDTFGNTGNLRIPAQHTAPGTFVNSAGAGLGRIHEQQTGHNPFLQSQFTGMPQTTYNNTASAGAFGSSPFGRQVPAATGPAGMNGGGVNGFGQSSNPFGPRPQQGQNGQGGGDLIQF
jgi:epsin